GLADALFDLLEVRPQPRARIGAHDDVQARVARAGDLRVTLHVAAGKALAGDLLDALAHLGVVAIARHVDQAGVEAVVGIAAHQQAHGATLVQVDDSAHDADQVGDAGLEQLIARVGLEYVQYRLAVVAGGVESEVADDLIHLAAQYRNVARAAGIGGRGPQPEKGGVRVHPPAAGGGASAHVSEPLHAAR